MNLSRRFFKGKKIAASKRIRLPVLLLLVALLRLDHPASTEKLTGAGKSSKSFGTLSPSSLLLAK